MADKPHNDNSSTPVEPAKSGISPPSAESPPTSDDVPPGGGITPPNGGDGDNLSGSGQFDPANGLPGLGDMAQQAEDLRQYRDRRANDRVVYSQFADLEHGMRIIEEHLDRLSNAALSDNDRNVCGDVRMFLFRMRRSCYEATWSKDNSEGETERNRLARNLDEIAYPLLYPALKARFTELCAEYKEDRYIPPPTEIPTTNEEMEQWYYHDLHEQDRYFVLAMAALESAPLIVVTQAALEIKQHFDKPDDEKAKESLPNQSTQALLARTFTMRRTINGSERVFWQKPEIILRARRFVAEQMLGMGQAQEFMGILRKWATNRIGERAVLAIQMLAFVQWEYDQDGLREMARAWTAEKHSFSAAALLAGAYEAEREAAMLAQMQRDPSTKIADHMPKSKVLEWLRQWARPQQPSKALHRVAIFAYGMIGTRWPTVALDGIESAMDAGDSGNGLAFDKDIWWASMANYAIIAWNGHLREVLPRLATIACRFVDRPRGMAAVSGGAKRTQHQLPLLTVFAAFFLIAVSSLRDTKESTTYDLHKPMPDHPDIPLADGRDVVLLALISSVETALRRDIVTLLAAAIVERQLDPAFDLLRRWANNTWKEPEDAELSNAFMTCFMEVAAQLRRWDATLAAPRPAFPILSQKLSLWAQSTHYQQRASKAFALAALKALAQ